MEKPAGVLYLIPNLLCPIDSIDRVSVLNGLPAISVARIRRLRHFIVEGDKVAWRLLAAIMDKDELATIQLDRLDEHTPQEELPRLLAPALAGEDVGMISEAGLPCIADPGGALAALAHDRKIKVVPLMGPSSLILALAASGLNGQHFAFLGYLPPEASARCTALAAIDRGVRSDGGTRLFIETPYRNDRMLADCLIVLSPTTRLCIAASLTTENERIVSLPVAEWKTSTIEPFGKVPAVFLVGEAPGTSLDRTAQFSHSFERPCRKQKR